MNEHANQDPAYRSAVGTMKAHGIVSLIFGILGALFGLLFSLAVMFFGYPGSYDDYEAIETLLGGFAILLLIVLPHVYLIIAGVALIRKPAPRLARGLTIANLVVGALSNLIILILAIISLVQLPDYDKGYKK